MLETLFKAQFAALFTLVWWPIKMVCITAAYLALAGGCWYLAWLLLGVFPDGPKGPTEGDIIARIGISAVLAGTVFVPAVLKAIEALVRVLCDAPVRTEPLPQTHPWEK